MEIEISKFSIEQFKRIGLIFPKGFIRALGSRIYWVFEE